MLHGKLVICWCCNSCTSGALDACSQVKEWKFSILVFTFHFSWSMNKNLYMYVYTFCYTILPLSRFFFSLALSCARLRIFPSMFVMLPSWIHRILLVCSAFAFLPSWHVCHTLALSASTAIICKYRNIYTSRHICIWVIPSKSISRYNFLCKTYLG